MSLSLRNNDNWDLFERVLQGLCDAWTAQRFIPVLEADIVGYLYYLLVTENGGDASRWHLDTRLRGAKVNDKFDLVCGPIVSRDEQHVELNQLARQLPEEKRRLINSKAVTAQLRPLIAGTMVLEVKLFATGFTGPQHHEHFRQALNDIERLKSLGETYPEARAAIFVDAELYLGPERRQHLVEARGDIDRSLRLYLCEHRDAKATWQLL